MNNQLQNFLTHSEDFELISKDQFYNNGRFLQYGHKKLYFLQQLMSISKSIYSSWNLYSLPLSLAVEEVKIVCTYLYGRPAKASTSCSFVSTLKIGDSNVTLTCTIIYLYQTGDSRLTNKLFKHNLHVVQIKCWICNEAGLLQLSRLKRRVSTLKGRV